MRHYTVWLLTGALALGGVSCSSYNSYRQAQTAEQAEDWDQAVLHYLELVDREPANIRFRAGLQRAKIQASHQHFEKGKRFHKAGALERAMVEYQQAVQLDTTNQYAIVELRKVRDELEAKRLQRDASGTLEELKEKVRGSQAQPPVLNPRSDQPIDLDFPQPVSVLDIYRALGKAYGINVLFDPKLQEQRIAIELKQVSARDALEILMRAAGHFYKVLDEHSIIVVADTPQNRRAYEDLVIQTFFLSNTEVKDVMSMLRSLVDARKIAANEQLNAIILRDTADRVKVAERIIRTNDKARAEVVVDVELLQINASKMQDLGISLSSYQIVQSLDTGDEVLRLSDLDFIDQSDWTLTIPSIIYDFVKTSTDAQLLARPQLRISEGEKARLVIGDRVPIPVTTFNTANTVGSNIVPITSFQYTEVGITVEIEPRVHHNEEISLQLRVEVSDITGVVSAGGGQQQPIIGTRTIESTIRLKDGETNFLAGLLRTDESESKTGIPGLSDIPILGRLFTKNTTENQRTDIVLTMTPHLIRKADVTEEDLLPIWVGTESNITFRGGSPRVESNVEGPFDEDQPAAGELQQRIRERLQRLPRGLREQPEEEEEPPSGVDLVPSAPPRGLFEEREAEEEETPEPEGGGEELGAMTRPSGRGRTTEARGFAFAAELQEEPVIRLSLSPKAVRVAPGELFEVDLGIAARVAVSHLPSILRFDPEVLEVEKVEPGEFLGSPAEAEVLADFSRAGELVLGASRLGELEGVTGYGVVARVTFRAKGPGATEVTFNRVKALDPALFNLQPLRWEPASVVVGEPGRGVGGPERPADRKEV